MASKFMRTDHDPPVRIAPRTGSANLGSLVGKEIRILLQSASSSSATICAIADETCWPISAFPTITVTMPSGPIEYHGVGPKLLAASAPGMWLAAT